MIQTSDLSAVRTTWRDVWRYVLEATGEQCVMTSGTLPMQQSCAGNLDSPQLVCYSTVSMYYSAFALVTSELV